MTEPTPGLWGGVPKAEGDSRTFANVNMNVHTGSAHAHTRVHTTHTPLRQPVRLLPVTRVTEPGRSQTAGYEIDLGGLGRKRL